MYDAGTLLNGVRLSKGVSAPLRFGDEAVVVCRADGGHAGVSLVLQPPVECDAAAVAPRDCGSVAIAAADTRAAGPMGVTVADADGGCQCALHRRVVIPSFCRCFQ